MPLLNPKKGFSLYPAGLDLFPDATLFPEDSAEQDEGWKLSIETVVSNGYVDPG